MNKFIKLMAVLRRKAHLPAVALLALMSGLSAKADVVVDATTFPDANFRNWILSQTYGKDGMLTDAEIAGVQTINCPSTKIASLKGIEYFTALSTLLCSNNQLTSVDVSKNTALRHLNITSNQLTSLDVSNNPALEVLYCEANQLTSLDVSNNTALFQLFCQNNQLTSLDLSANTALLTLRCSGNQLTELDLSTNPISHTLDYTNQTRTLTAELAVTPEGKRYYYLRLDNNVNGDKTIVERMTETNFGGEASKFDPSRVLAWTSGGNVSDGILLLTDVRENAIAASGTVKYKYKVNNSKDPNGNLGDFTLHWIAFENGGSSSGQGALELNEKGIRLQVTQSHQLEVLTPNAGEITWTSDNPEIVEVDTTGRVTALKNGKAIITATAANGSSTWCCVVSYKLGDLNEDMKVDIADMNMITDIILTQE